MSYFDQYPAPSDADIAEARQLIDEGYIQVSAKNRRLARLPDGKNGYEALKEVSPDTADRFYELFLRSCAAQYLRCHGRDHLQVTPEVFRALKQLGVKVA
jgi:hypothetical protein